MIIIMIIIIIIIIIMLAQLHAHMLRGTTMRPATNCKRQKGGGGGTKGERQIVQK